MNFKNFITPRLKERYTGASFDFAFRNVTKFVKGKLLVSITLTSDQQPFSWMDYWFYVNNITDKHKDVFVVVNNSSHYEDDAKVPEHQYVPGMGIFYFKYKDRLFWVNKSQDVENKRMEYVITTTGNTIDIFDPILEEARQLAIKSKLDCVQVYQPGYYTNWECILTKPKRSLDSVILPDNTIDNILKDIDNFHGSKDWYAARNIPYQRGYLFYGPSGTGKTSLITALASHYNVDVYSIDLSSVTTNKLPQLLANVPVGNFIIVEDIDRYFKMIVKRWMMRNQLQVILLALFLM